MDGQQGVGSPHLALAANPAVGRERGDPGGIPGHRAQGGEVAQEEGDEVLLLTP